MSPGDDDIQGNPQAPRAESGDQDATNYGDAPPAATDSENTRYPDAAAKPDTPDATTFPPLNDPTATRCSDEPADPDVTLPPSAPSAASAATAGEWATLGYEILGELGRGGMGVVYKARQLKLNRLVALKMILSGAHASGDDLARFRTEAEAVARLQHPHIVQVYEVGEHDGRPFFSLEFCPGGNLDKKLNGTPLPPREAARLVETLARAVQALHQQKVVHRDLKPANVLLTADGQPKLTDFGLAKKLDEVGQTRSGAVMGTPSYMAPEQADGKSKEIGPAADVYALGAILYECLTGRPPFKAATQLDTLIQVVADEPVPPRQLQSKTPRDLETICLKCLSKESAKRYGSAEALAKDLERWLRDEPVRARPVGAMERAAKWARRRPALAAAYGLLLAALVLGVGVGGATWLWQRAEAARQDAENARNVAEHARLAEKEARGKEEDQRRRAEQFAAEVREQAVRFDVAGGVRLLDDGDQLGALGWFAHALKLDEGDADREQPHRLRLAAILRESPRLTQLWLHNKLTCAALSPDGRLAATGGEDRAVRVWDATTGWRVAEWQLEGRANAVAFSPDSRLLVAAAEDGKGRVWHLDGGGLAATLPHDGPVLHAAFSPDGLRVVTTSKDKTARLWETATWVCTGTLMHQDAVLYADFSMDGSRVVTAGLDTTARVWNADDGKQLYELKHDGPVLRASFGPDGTRVLTVDGLHKSFVWDLTTAQPSLEFVGQQVLAAAISPDGHGVLTGCTNGSASIWKPHSYPNTLAFQKQHTGNIVCAGFSPDGRQAITGGEDGTAQVWDASTGLAACPPLKHAGPVLQALFSRDGRHVLTASRDGTARLWEVAPPRAAVVVLKHPAAVRQAWFSPEGRTVLTACQDGKARLWDAETGRILLTLQQDGPVIQSAYSLDGRRVVTVGRNGTARDWNASTGVRLCEVKHEEGEIRAAAYSPDGRRLATAGGDGVARVWDADTGEALTPPLKHSGPVNGIAFSPDGESLVAAVGPSSKADEPFQGEAVVWDARRGAPRGPPLKHQQSVVAVSFSPDGRRMLTASADGDVQIWDWAAGNPAAATLRHGGVLTTAAFSPDGRWVVTAGQNGLAQVWDGETGEPAGPTLKHPGPVSHAAFSPDSRLVVTADGAKDDDDDTQVQQIDSLVTSAGKKARVWDAATGEAITPWLYHDRHVTWAAFSPDGRRVVTASEDNTARIWDLSEDGRPAADLAELADVLNGRRFRTKGGSVPLPSDVLQKSWQALKEKYPADYASTSEGVLAWHRGEAEAAEVSKDGFAAAWHLDQLIAAEPGDASLYVRRAEVHTQRGDIPSAVADYTKAMELEPANGQLPFRRGDLRARAREWDHAVADYSRAIDLGMKDAVVWVQRGEAFVQLGERDLAQTDCKKAGEQDSQDAEFPRRLASLRVGINGMVRSLFVKKAHSDRPAFPVHLQVDHADRRYGEGEAVRLTVTSEKDGYLYLFCCDAADRVVCLFPGKSQKNAHITAGESVTVPAEKAGFTVRIEPPRGLQVFKAVVTQEPLKGPAFDALAEQDLTEMGTGQGVFRWLGALESELKKQPEKWSENTVDIAGATKVVGAFIGINTYNEKTLGNLQFADRDARDMAEAMRDKCVQEEFVLINENATLENIKALLLRKLPEATKPGDTVILFWSGRGFAGTNPPPNPGGPPDSHFYLIPYNGQVAVRRTLLSDDALAAALTCLEDRTVLVIVDTPYSGEMLERVVGNEKFSILAGCDRNQGSYEHEKLGHGVFSYALLEYVSKLQGPFKLPEAYQYARNRMPAVLQLIDKHPGSQVPVLGDLESPARAISR